MNKMCEYEGKIQEVDFASEVPKRIVCPCCKRRMKPKIVACSCCGCDRDLSVACYIHIYVPRHKVKKWWKK